MNATDELAASLARINADALARFIIPKNTPMEAVAIRLAAGGGRRPPGPSADFGLRLTAALTKFRNGNRNEVDFRTLRLICHGCCHYVEADRYILIGDAEALRSLIGHVAGYAHERRRFRRLFDGLLRAYFGIDRTSAWFKNPAVGEGNEALRTFLDGTFDDIAALDPRPDWVLAVVTYRQVLSPDPGQQFAQGWLDGRTQEFQDMAQRLGLSGTAWLLTETVRSALQLAVKLPDKQFTPHVTAFLAAAIEPRFQVLSNEIYASLLNRYGELANPTVHSLLRDAVVGTWKNPWLALNDSAWGRVTPKARQMVTSWLKLELIHQFFEVLSEDGQDQRRFKFWLRYHDQLDGVQFALSREVLASRDRDKVKFKAAAEGLICQLTGSTSDNNSFVMRMGSVVAVEFSKYPNAAFLHNSDSFALDPASGSVNIKDLREDCLERLVHAGARGQAWEEIFAEKLLAAQRLGSRSPAPPLAALPPARVEPPLASLSETIVAAFADMHRLRHQDHRPKGGSLWVFIDDDEGPVARQLTTWGFKYRAGKGWWRSQ